MSIANNCSDGITIVIKQIFYLPFAKTVSYGHIWPWTPCGRGHFWTQDPPTPYFSHSGVIDVHYETQLAITFCVKAYLRVQEVEPVLRVKQCLNPHNQMGSCDWEF